MTTPSPLFTRLTTEEAVNAQAVADQFRNDRVEVAEGKPPKTASQVVDYANDLFGRCERDLAVPDLLRPEVAETCINGLTAIGKDLVSPFGASPISALSLSSVQAILAASEKRAALRSGEGDPPSTISGRVG